jgi:hypothetical protein
MIYIFPYDQIRYEFYSSFCVSQGFNVNWWSTVGPSGIPGSKSGWPGVWFEVMLKGRPRIISHIGMREDQGVIVGIPSVAMIRY